MEVMGFIWGVGLLLRLFTRYHLFAVYCFCLSIVSVLTWGGNIQLQAFHSPGSLLLSSFFPLAPRDGSGQ